MDDGASLEARIVAALQTMIAGATLLKAGRSVRGRRPAAAATATASQAGAELTASPRGRSLPCDNPTTRASRTFGSSRSRRTCRPSSGSRPRRATPPVRRAQCASIRLSGWGLTCRCGAAVELPASSPAVAIADIQELVVGQSTKVFQQNPIPEHKDLSFSLIYGGGARTLDVVCKVRRLPPCF